MHTIIVDWRRLESGVFHKQGDISAAYSCEALSDGNTKGKGVRAFTHDGKLYTHGGGASGPGGTYACCYELIPSASYTGTTEKVPYSYEGKLVKYKGAEYRLGPKVEFRAGDKTVQEHRDYERECYKRGGYFTAGKTYHQVLRSHLQTLVARGLFVDGSPIAEAIRLELEQPDFDKHKPTPPTTKPAEPLEQQAWLFALGIL